MSTFSLYGLLSITSGAMYSQDPVCPALPGGYGVGLGLGIVCRR